MRNFEVSLKSADYEIIHLSTGHLGGAGLAARRLNEALNHSGINSTFAALARNDFVPLTREISIPRNPISKFLGGVLAVTQSRLSKKIFFSLISYNSLNVRFLIKLTDPQKTILHIHNWFNLLNMRSILNLQKSGFHIVITLHDQRVMTGGCHYPIGCRKFEQSCSNCPLLPVGMKVIPSIILKSSIFLFKKYSSNITFVAPSNWIMSEAHKSKLLQSSNVVFIPNTLGPVENHFIPTDQILREITLSQKTKIGIASMDSKSYVKGGDITDQIFELLKSNSFGFEFVFMNDFDQSNNGKMEFWQSIDYLLVVSRAENSPNVIHEAKQLGIPVIASMVGGITEMLDLGHDIGIEPENLNSTSVLKILKGVTSRHTSRDLQQKMQIKFHDYVTQSVASHIDLYEKVMNKG